MAPAAAAAPAAASHSLAPRRGAKGKTYVTPPDALGRVTTLQADEHGIVHPESTDEARAADILGLPVITMKESTSHG